MSKPAHQAGAYPGFFNMKQLGVFLLPPGWDASPSQGYLPALNVSPLTTQLPVQGVSLPPTLIAIPGSTQCPWSHLLPDLSCYFCPYNIIREPVAVN